MIGVLVRENNKQSAPETEEVAYPVKMSNLGKRKHYIVISALQETKSGAIANQTSSQIFKSR